jgi:hypothetical protein
VAAAPRSQGEALWTRFKAAQSRSEVQDYFSQQAAERQDALKKKEELCARAEALRLDRLGEDGRGDEDAAGRMEPSARSPAAAKGHLGTLPQGLRRLFTRRPGRHEAAQAGLGENLSEGSPHRRGRQLAQSTSWEQASARLKRCRSSGSRSVR